MEDQYLELSWKEARNRYEGLKGFVAISAQSTPRGDQAYRASLHSSWILLTYAATQAALVNLAKVTLQVIRSVGTTPESLPEDLRKAHFKRTLSFLYAQSASDLEDEGFEDALRSLTTDEWYKYTRLTHIDGNVWPRTIREWMNRMLVEKTRLRWMDSPLGDSSETVASRLNQLVEERNEIAHGEIPENFLAPKVMCAWIGDSCTFVRQSVNTLQAHLADTFDLESQSVGELNESVKLGDTTVGLSRVGVDLSIGDHVRLYSIEKQSRIASVLSIQSKSQQLDTVKAGQTEVAITLNRKILQSTLYCVL